MVNAQTIQADITVDALLGMYPQLIPFFLQHHMACVGCAISRFHTLTEIADIYGMAVESIISELQSYLDEEGGDATTN